jgi:hypothetical protein
MPAVLVLLGDSRLILRSDNPWALLSPVQPRGSVRLVRITDGILVIQSQNLAGIDDPLQVIIATGIANTIVVAAIICNTAPRSLPSILLALLALILPLNRLLAESMRRGIGTTSPLPVGLLCTLASALHHLLSNSLLCIMSNREVDMILVMTLRVGILASMTWSATKTGATQYHLKGCVRGAMYLPTSSSAVLELPRALMPRP